MAVLKLSWFIESISGRDGNVVYYMRRGTQCLRVYIKPPDPNTQAQKENRGRFGMAVRSWQLLTDEEKNKFAIRAKHINMSGYNLFISEFMKAETSSKAKSEIGNRQKVYAYSEIYNSSSPGFSRQAASLQHRFRSVSYSFHSLTRPFPIANTRQFTPKG